MFLKSGLGTHKYGWYGGIPALIKGAPKLVNVTVPERSIPLSKSDTQNKAWLTVSIEKMALNEFVSYSPHVHEEDPSQGLQLGWTKNLTLLLPLAQSHWR